LVLAGLLVGASCADEIVTPATGADASDAGTGVDRAVVDGTSSDGWAADDVVDNGAPIDGARDASDEDGGCAATCTGRCFGERCIVELASEQMRPYAVAVNATHLYWTTNENDPGTPPPNPGALKRVPLAGGNAEALASDLITPHTLALDGTSVYWTSFVPKTGALEKMPLGGQGAITTLAANQDNCHGLLVAGQAAYFTNYGSGVVAKAPTDGNGPIIELAVGQQDPTHLAADATYLYWTNWVSPAGSIARVPRDGGPTEVVVADQLRPYGIAVDVMNVYWTNSVGGTVMRKPLAGGAGVVLATVPSSQGYPFSLVLDDGYVYFTTYNEDVTGSVRKVPIGGGEVTVVSDRGAYNLAVDATSVYTTTYQGRKILRITPKLIAATSELHVAPYRASARATRGPDGRAVVGPSTRPLFQKPTEEKTLRRRAPDFGNGIDERNLFGANFDAVLRLAAIFDAAVAHDRLESFTGVHGT
jgi:hypothetical protein